MPEFCDIAVPVPLDMVFTYRVPANATPVVGGRVLAPFRQQRMTGIVVELRPRNLPVPPGNFPRVLGAPPVRDDSLVFGARGCPKFFPPRLGKVSRPLGP